MSFGGRAIPAARMGLAIGVDGDPSPEHRLLRGGMGMEGELAAGTQATAHERSAHRGEQRLVGIDRIRIFTLVFLTCAAVYYAAIGYLVYLAVSALP